MKKRLFRAEKEFGLIVGGALFLLSLWWLYRGKLFVAAEVALPLGSVLILLGLIYPRALGLPNRGWMMLAEALSFVTNQYDLMRTYDSI